MRFIAHRGTEGTEGDAMRVDDAGDELNRMDRIFQNISAWDYDRSLRRYPQGDTTGKEAGKLNPSELLYYGRGAIFGGFCIC